MSAAAFAGKALEGAPATPPLTSARQGGADGAAGRVHLGWNTWTMPWVDGDPIDAPDHPRQASDWRRFLAARSAELRPGAKLLTAFSAETADETGWEWMSDEILSSVCDLGRDGILFSQE